MDWSTFTGLFRFGVSPVELIVRGTVMYWGLFLLFRFVLRRDAGSLAIADILLLVLIADAAQNAMAGGYETLAEGCVLVATIAAWNYLLDWGCYRSERVRRFAEPDPLRLVHNGHILRANLRRELLTVDELKAKLREQGVEDLAQVAHAFMESDGQISVIRADDGSGPSKRPTGATLP